MSSHEKKLCIFGTGGFGRETLLNVIDLYKGSNIGINDLVCFVTETENQQMAKLLDVEVIPQSKFDPIKYDVVIGIGDPVIRKRVAALLPPTTSFRTIIHPSVIMSRWVNIGMGSIICAGVILTCGIKIGNHAQLNLNSTIGHDCRIGDFFSCSPGVNISGNCIIGDSVFIGTNSSLKEGVEICDNVKVGMGSTVIKDIREPGTYFGNPIKKIC